jgi:hypothetical protein
MKISTERIFSALDFATHLSQIKRIKPIVLIKFSPRLLKEFTYEDRKAR